MPARTSIVALVVLGLGSVQCARLADLGDGVTTGSSSQTGDGGAGNPNVSVMPTTMSFQAAACGADSMDTRYLVITNTGAADAPYQVQLPEGAAYRVMGNLQGTVSAHSNVSLTVFATPSLATDNAADILVSAGGTAQLIHATVNGTGPTMDLDPALVAFGSVQEKSGGGPLPVTVKNHGTTALVVQATDMMVNPGTPWSVGGFPLTVMPNQTGTFTVSLAPGSEDATPLTGQVTTGLKGLCGTPPVLALTGKRVDVQLSVTDDDFGSQDCGSSPAEQDVTISNYYTTAINYVMTPAPSSNFTIVDTGNGVVQASSDGIKAATAIVKVTPKGPLPTTSPLPEWTEALHFVFSSQEGSVNQTLDSTLHVRDQGAILTYPATISFGNNFSVPFTVTNSGNEDVDMAMAYQNGTPFVFSLSPTSVTTITGPGSHSGTANVFVSKGSATFVPFINNQSKVHFCSPLSDVQLSK